MKLIFFLLVFSTQCLAKDIYSECSKDRGQIRSYWICPSLDKVRSGTFCFLKDKYQNEIVYNGCSFGEPGFNEIFFKSCKEHDLCYHHEPVTSGLLKADCDERFLRSMLQTCRKNPQIENCEKVAKVYFRSVQVFGFSGWKCSKEFADYFTFLQ
jgi:hypothetical protein